MPLIDFRARPNTSEYLSMSGMSAAEGISVGDFVTTLSSHSIDLAVFTGRQGVGGYLPNDRIADAVRQFPSKFIGFAGVDPREGPAAIKELERAVTELGLPGLALDPPDHPDDRYGRGYDDERVMYPLYEKANSLKIPVVLTMGPRTVRFDAPRVADRIAADFPSLTLVCSHSGWPEATEWVAVGLRRKNVIIEPSLYWFYPGTEPLFAAANDFLQDQVVYASAFPFNPLDSITRFRKRLTTPEVEAKVTYKNAARILGLSTDRLNAKAVTSGVKK
jgi:uncharacterized protein